MSIPTRVLGRTGRAVSLLGLGGAAALGSPGGVENDARAVEIAQRAFDLGVTYVDTAPLYGRGDSERRIGAALRDRPDADRILIATKVGYVPDDYDYSFDATIASVEASRQRLGLDAIPLVQIHEIRSEIRDVAMGPHGALTALTRLRDEGKIRWIGVTGSALPELTRAIETGAFDVALVWRHFNLLDRSGASVLSTAEALGLGMIIGTVYASGILARGSRDPASRHFYDDVPAEIHQRVEAIERACATWNVSLAAAALQFATRVPSVSSVIVGADEPDQVDANVRALNETIPDRFWEEIADA
ncbi:MAG: aldo/keto reductase [Chloroflexota bacterium]|nr:MAG: aldo/keto reductase [Chloroflexota bacterium]